MESSANRLALTNDLSPRTEHKAKQSAVQIALESMDSGLWVQSGPIAQTTNSITSRVRPVQTQAHMT